MSTAQSDQGLGHQLRVQGRLCTILYSLLLSLSPAASAIILQLNFSFCQALDDELKGPMEVVEMSRERAQRLALQEASIAVVTSLLPALEPVEQVSSSQSSKQ